MSYVISLSTATLIFIVLLISVNIQWGSIGLVTLSTAAFAGIGAYSTIYFASALHIHGILPALAGIALTGLVSLVVSSVIFRFRGLYLIITTLAFQYLAQNVFDNWSAFTRGSLGVTNVRAILGGAPTGDAVVFAVTATCTLIVLLVAGRFIYHAQFGVTLQAVQDDEIAAQSIGLSPYTLKLAGFMAASMIAALGGILLALHLDYVNPGVFSLEESVFLLGGVIVGGRGTLLGSVCGGIFLICIPECLRFMPLPVSLFAELRQVLYGLVLLVFLIRWPEGLVPRS